MLSMKSVASALVLVATAADVAVPVMIAPALVIAASTAARAAPAFAEPSTHQKVVSYRDLNLASPSGLATFKARARRAAEDVCSPAPEARSSLAQSVDFQACVDEAVAGALVALPQAQQQAARPNHVG